MEKTAAFVTLGCKVNQYETEAMKRILREKGYRIVGAKEQADLYLINTCAVTNLSAAKSRQAIRKGQKINPAAKIIVVGCYAQAEPEEIARIAGVSLVLGTKEKDRLAEFLDDLQETAQCYVGDVQAIKEFSHLATGDYQDRTRAFIKIQEGCEQFCTYCLIPYLRGPVRSRAPEEIIAEVKKLLLDGFSEIVLIGIHIGVYGQEDRQQKGTLAQLLGQLVPLEGLQRIRLGSLEPTDFDAALLDIVSRSEKICPHFHIPLQSGSDKILRAMNRGYDTVFYADLVQRIRQTIPLAAISTDLMVGFPGETEADFLEMMYFVEQMAFSRVHVFPYSKRPGTPAATMINQVTTREKEHRSRELRTLTQKLSAAYAEKFLGSVVLVLVEEEQKDLLAGLTPHYLKAFFAGEAELMGKIIPVCLNEVKEGQLYGTRRADDATRATAQAKRPLSDGKNTRTRSFAEKRSGQSRTTENS